MAFFSSDDSPEKSPYCRSPGMQRKSNSASSTDSLQNISGSPKYKSERNLQNQVNDLQDSENSDVDIETDNVVDINYLKNQGQKNSEISTGIKLKNNFYPEFDRCENSINARRRLYQSKEQAQRLEPSVTIESINSTNSGPFSSMKNIYIICCIIVIIILSISFYSIKYPATSSLNGEFNATIVVNNLKSNFKDQPLLTFRIIHKALTNVLGPQPKAPAIILLLATNGSETICRKFALRLVELLSVPESNHVKIFGKEYNGGNTNRAKMDIDKAISKVLKENQLGSVLIDGLDQIPGQAALIFHKYCDDENAPFKRAVFVMTVHYNQAISDYSDVRLWDKAANDHLLSVWTDTGIDQATPLLTRLTVSVVVIKA